MKIFRTRNEMIAQLPKRATVAELGVFEGEFSKIIHTICQPRVLYLVDLFTGYFGSGDKDGRNYHYVQLETEMEKIQDHFKEDPGVQVVKSSTTEFLQNIPKDHLDIVYIDADHSYASVLSDLRMSYSKIKPGGFICGHDYIAEARVAVDHFCAEKGLEILYLTEDGCPSFCIQMTASF